MALNATQVPTPQVMEGNSTLTPNQGDRFVVINATLTNVNATDRYVQGSYFLLRDSNGISYSAYGIQNNVQTFPLIVQTQPGVKLNGLLLFEAPQNAKLTALVYDDHASAGNDYRGNVTAPL